MGLSVATRATTFRLTTKERVKLEVSTIPSSDDALLDFLNDAASDAIQSYCNRAAAPFARQAYTETLGAFGDVSLMLKGTPLVVVSTVLQDGSPLTDWSIEDAATGIIHRRNQFFWTAQLNPGLGGRQTWPSVGSPIPGSEEKRFSVSYVAGYLMPSQDLTAKSTVSASAVDSSFNDSASGFPALLQAGDTFTAAGFTNAANNGTFTVSGTPTTSKVVVTATLTTESAPSSTSFIFRTLPYDLEAAAVETIKAWYFDREKSSATLRERVGATDTQYADPFRLRSAIPATAIGYLNGYRRAA